MMVISPPMGFKTDMFIRCKLRLNAVARREQSLGLFHALGKVLYNKRQSCDLRRSVAALNFFSNFTPQVWAIQAKMTRTELNRRKDKGHMANLTRCRPTCQVVRDRGTRMTST